jgi:hypothetical protein
MGVIIAVAVVSGCHYDEAGCCPPWGFPGNWHWELGAVRLLPDPVAVRGALGLWRPPDDVAAQVDLQLAI